jgi:hypothetical protein
MTFLEPKFTQTGRLEGWETISVIGHPQSLCDSLANYIAEVIYFQLGRFSCSQRVGPFSGVHLEPCEQDDAEVRSTAQRKSTD